MHSRGRLMLTLVCPLLFGVLMAVAKGQDEGVRNAFGNVSAPWVLIAFAAGSWWSGFGRATLAGLAATWLALVGFYGALSVIYDLAPNPWYIDVQRTFQAGTSYFVPGAVTGAAFGALGGAWRQYRLLAAALAAALALMLEPLALDAFGIDRGSGDPLRYPVLWLTEIAAGVVLFSWALHRRRRNAFAKLLGDARRRLDM